MSDSDMDIDDEDVQVVVQHTIARGSGLLGKPLKASYSRNEVKKHLDEQSKIIKEPCGSLSNLQPNVSGKIGKNLMLGEEKGMILSRFPAPAQSFPSGNGYGPEHKRPAVPCKYFAQGRCASGNSCWFLHVNENTNCTSQQQVVNNMAGSSGIQSVEERRPLESKEGGRFPLLSENGVTSLVNPSGGQRAFPFTNEIRFMPSLENMGRGSLQNGGAVFTENNPLSFPLNSSFVQEHGSYKQTDMGSSGPAWTGSLFSPQYASTLGNFENKNDINGSGSLPMVQATSVSSVQDAEVDKTSTEKRVSSNDWEPSEPFRASFTIPPYILPSSEALYDPYTDIEIPQDRSINAPSSSKGRDAQKKSSQQKGGDSGSCPQARDCNNDDKNSTCSQTQYQETVARKNMEAVEGVATSVVDQNDETTPSKEVSSSAAVENIVVVLKRSKPAGHGSWRRSNGSSHQKALKSDERDGEVRSDAGMKVMRKFRTAVVETIKEMVKPLWREGRLTKDVHNMVVKRASEKIVSAAVQSHLVPTDSASVEQYLSLSAPKIVKLVEGYVEKYGKPKP